MFNFLKSKTKNIEADKKQEYIAKITYYISQDKEPMIDVHLEDYEDRSINALCDLLNILSKDSIISETVNIIQDFLIRDNKKEELLKIFLCLENLIKATHKNNYNAKDDTFIKPSEILRK